MRLLEIGVCGKFMEEGIKIFVRCPTEAVLVNGGEHPLAALFVENILTNRTLFELNHFHLHVCLCCVLVSLKRLGVVVNDGINVLVGKEVVKFQ